uniref:Uncharacterized protein n=1 Tax=Opuntia streptacantha TaxID=393608 RepID=A0A7C8YK17_OPUST
MTDVRCWGLAKKRKNKSIGKDNVDCLIAFDALSDVFISTISQLHPTVLKVYILYLNTLDVIITPPKCKTSPVLIDIILKLYVCRFSVSASANFNMHHFLPVNQFSPFR